MDLGTVAPRSHDPSNDDHKFYGYEYLAIYHVLGHVFSACYVLRLETKTSFP